MVIGNRIPAWTLFWWRQPSASKAQRIFYPSSWFIPEGEELTACLRQGHTSIGATCQGGFGPFVSLIWPAGPLKTGGGGHLVWLRGDRWHRRLHVPCMSGVPCGRKPARGVSPRNAFLWPKNAAHDDSLAGKAFGINRSRPMTPMAFDPVGRPILRFAYCGSRASERGVLVDEFKAFGAALTVAFTFEWRGPWPRLDIEGCLAAASTQGTHVLTTVVPGGNYGPPAAASAAWPAETVHARVFPRHTRPRQ